MTKLISAAVEVHLDEPAFNLTEVNLQAPDNSGWRRYQIISVVRGERMAEYREDLGPKKDFTADAFPIDVQVASLESAGYVYVYDTENGERSVVNRNMLESQLQKMRPDDTRYFTTVKPNIEPKRGTLKCLLHSDDPDRGQYDIWGFATCNKSNLISEFQVNRHVQIRHRMEW